MRFLRKLGIIGIAVAVVATSIGTASAAPRHGANRHVAAHGHAGGGRHYARRGGGAGGAAAAGAALGLFGAAIAGAAASNAYGDGYYGGQPAYGYGRPAYGYGYDGY